MPNLNSWVRGAGAVPLLFEVQVDLVPASGLQPTVEVIRYPDGFVADWSAMEFVAAGAAVSGQAKMSGWPDVLGLYRRDFDPGAFGESSSLKQIYVARYRVTIPSGYNASVEEDTDLTAHDSHIFKGSDELVGSFNGG